MSSDLKQELLHTAEQVQQFLEQDTFPEQIYPTELRAAVKAYPLQGGKRLRPVLVLWSCGMMGGDPGRALPAAVATEIYHNWTLVHDDIIDCDDIRRGQASTHEQLRKAVEELYDIRDHKLCQKYGRDLAILAGDIQQGWACNTLLQLSQRGVSAEVVLALVQRMQESLNRELISGEAIDVTFSLRDPETVKKDEILQMISGKTGALLRYCVQSGVAIATDCADFNTPQQRAAENFAGNLGAAFQLQDDLLGLYGDFESFGKPIGSDFQEAKPTLLFTEAWNRMDTVQQTELSGLLRLPEYGETELKKIRELISSCGAEKRIRELSEELSVKALQSLGRFPENRYRKLLEELTMMLICRKI